jgi:catechol 2,3-dioxygenase-like lactoylglutathione lyase family enzyme
MITRLTQVAVVVQDLDRAVRFYRDTLGLKLLFQAPPGLAFFDLSGVRLMLDQPSEPLPRGVGTSILYYGVDDIQAAHAALVGRGVPFEEAPHMIANLGDRDLWMGAFRDSEGNLLGLMSEVRHAPSRPTA